MLKHFISIIVLVLLVTSNAAFSKIRGESSVDSLHSKILDEKRELLIHLPNNYHENKKLSYPVLYLLDGQRNLNHAAGSLDLLNQSKMAQEMIIVAIANTHRTRDLTPTYDENYNEWGISGGADNFLDFIEQELIPYVDKQYRTQNFKIVSGHSLGGLFSIYSLQSRPHLFQAHFAFSPSLWWHDQVIFKEAEKFFANTPTLNNYLYVNMGDEGGHMLSSYEKYTELLKADTPDGFTYNADLDTTENHNTTALVGQSLAYRYLYKTLQCPREIIAKGLPAIEAFFEEQSDLYGYEIQPSYSAVNSAGYNALTKKDYTTAIKIFETNVKNYPYKADAYDSLADGYKANGDLAKALEARKFTISKSISENVENNAYKTRKTNLLKLIEESKS